MYECYSNTEVSTQEREIRSVFIFLWIVEEGTKKILVLACNDDRNLMFLNKTKRDGRLVHMYVQLLGK